MLKEIVEAGINVEVNYINHQYNIMMTYRLKAKQGEKYLRLGFASLNLEIGLNELYKRIQLLIAAEEKAPVA